MLNKFDRMVVEECVRLGRGLPVQEGFWRVGPSDFSVVDLDGRKLAVTTSVSGDGRRLAELIAKLPDLLAISERVLKEVEAAEATYDKKGALT